MLTMYDKKKCHTKAYKEKISEKLHVYLLKYENISNSWNVGWQQRSRYTSVEQGKFAIEAVMATEAVVTKLFQEQIYSISHFNRIAGIFVLFFFSFHFMGECSRNKLQTTQ